MHEVSLGQILRDYLTGNAIESTTYEDLRQSLAKVFVEELGYNSANLIPKVEITFLRGAEEFSRSVDIVIYNDAGAPEVAVLFCAGQVNTFAREGLALARLLPKGPAPLLVITDTKTAVLFDVSTGKLLEEGIQALPRKEKLEKLLRTVQIEKLDEKTIEMEKRILDAYSQFQKTCCTECVSVE